MGCIRAAAVFSEAALAVVSSVARLAAASSRRAVINFYVSEAALAALRASAGSAARAAPVVCVYRAPAYAYSDIRDVTLELRAIGEPLPASAAAAAATARAVDEPLPAAATATARAVDALRSASAATDRTASSTTAPIAPTAFITAFLATDGVRASRSACSPGHHGYFHLPTPPSLGLLVPSSANFRGASLPTMAWHKELLFSEQRSPRRVYHSTTAGHEPPNEGIDDLIRRMECIDPNSNDALRFRVAFHKKFFPYWEAHHVAEHLRYQNYNFNGWFLILREVNKKVGPHKEAMEFMIKEGLESSEEVSMDPAVTRVEKKLDLVIKVQGEQGEALKAITKATDPRSKKPEWGSFKLFGRNMDGTKIINLWKIFF